MKILTLCLVVIIRCLKRFLNGRINVIEKYDDEKNFQYVSCIGGSKPVGKSTRLHQLDLYWIAIFSKQQTVKKNLNKILSFLCAGNSIKFYCMPLLNNVLNFVKIAETYLPKEQYNSIMQACWFQVWTFWEWFAKFNFEPLFGFIKNFKEYLKHCAQNGWKKKCAFVILPFPQQPSEAKIILNLWTSTKSTYYYNKSSFEFIFGESWQAYWPYMYCKYVKIKGN